MDPKETGWKGTWRNQYGSTLRITDETENRISGTFSTALRDSRFYGAEIPVVGVHRGDCISFTFAHASRTGDMICSFTGLRRDGKLQTVWHVVADAVSRGRGELPKIEKLGWAHAVLTNADTFERAGLSSD